MNAVQKKIFNCGIIPVIKLQDANDAVPLCDALQKGGIDVAEITFRTDAAEQSIRNVSKNMPNIFVGAGTVINVENTKKAIDAGAKFIVSPGMNEKVVEYCLKNNVEVLPGTSSPTDIEKGIDFGLSVLKFFPAEANGGLKALKAISAPYNNLKFMPTGGINATNVNDYLAFDKVIACGGSWMVNEDLVKAKDFDKVTEITKQAVNKMHNFNFAHVALNTSSKNNAIDLANLFDKTFGTGTRTTTDGAFAGNFIELMGTGDKAPGTNGHIGFRATNIARVIAYFEKLGIELNYESIKGEPDNPTFLYLKNEYNGFAIHVIKA